MASITPASITDLNSSWRISITDLTAAGTRFHANKNKLNFRQNASTCQFRGCNVVINRRLMSGLCSSHVDHQHSLFLQLHNPQNNLVNAPLHTEIVDKLIEWAGSRNFDLIPLFKDLSFNILGNIPDVSTLSADTTHSNFSPPSLQVLVDEVVSIVNFHLPDTNNSSYQPLSTKKGLIPARILALTFAGLVLCEEANRGDRWFNRRIRQAENQTELLGGAMPIAYFASRMFPWGIEIGRAAYRLVPSAR